MRGTGPYADMLAARFAAARSRLGLAERPPPFDFTAFSAAAAGPQLSLFETRHGKD